MTFKNPESTFNPVKQTGTFAELTEVNMSIARYERKEKLPTGAQKEIALKLDVAPSVVSRVNNDKVFDLSPKTVRRVRVAIARKIRMRVEDAFPPVAA